MKDIIRIIMAADGMWESFIDGIILIRFGRIANVFSELLADFCRTC